MKKINIGDWVTQYRTGYWKVKELHPKYSPFDCDRLHKGEPIGVEAVLQKAFNNTFKFNMEMSTCDLSLCQHVTKAVMRKIEKYFKEHPDDEIKFETSQLPVPPNVTAIHLNIDDAQRDHISSLLNIELPNLTYPKVKEILSDNGLTEVLCGAENTLLFLYGYSWEQNENFDMIYSLICSVPEMVLSYVGGIMLPKVQKESIPVYSLFYFYYVLLIITHISLQIF